jgi:hypothetical protein
MVASELNRPLPRRREIRNEPNGSTNPKEPKQMSASKQTEMNPILLEKNVAFTPWYW